MSSKSGDHRNRAVGASGTHSFRGPVSITTVGSTTTSTGHVVRGVSSVTVDNVSIDPDTIHGNSNLRDVRCDGPSSPHNEDEQECGTIEIVNDTTAEDEARARAARWRARPPLCRSNADMGARRSTMRVGGIQGDGSTTDSATVTGTSSRPSFWDGIPRDIVFTRRPRATK